MAYCVLTKNKPSLQSLKMCIVRNSTAFKSNCICDKSNFHHVAPK